MSETRQGISMEGMNVEQAFDPVARQAQQDLNSYVEARPYVDANGTAHNPENGQFINTDKYFDAQRADHEQQGLEQTSYDDLSMSELSRKLGDAELANDQTMADDVMDVLLEKIDAHVEKAKAGHAKSAGDEDVDLHAAWLDRMLAQKDRYKEEIRPLTPKEKAVKDGDFEAYFDAEEAEREKKTDKTPDEPGDGPLPKRKSGDGEAPKIITLEDALNQMEQDKAELAVQLAAAQEAGNEEEAANIQRRIDELDMGINHAKKKLEFDDKAGDTPEGEQKGKPTSPELEEADTVLAVARDKFAKLLAKRGRTVIGRKGSKAELAKAKQEYKEAFGQAGAEAVKLLQELGVSQEDITKAINYGAAEEVFNMTGAQFNYESQDGSKAKLLGWWHRQGGHKFMSWAGIKGSLKKGAVMAGPSAVVGVAIGGGAAVIAGAPIVAAGAVAAGVGFVSKGVARAYANAKISGAAESATFAEKKRNENRLNAVNIINQYQRPGDAIDYTEFADNLENQENTRKKRNTKRAAIGAGAAAVAGGLGFAVAHGVIDANPFDGDGIGWEGFGRGGSVGENVGQAAGEHQSGGGSNPAENNTGSGSESNTPEHQSGSGGGSSAEQTPTAPNGNPLENMTPQELQAFEDYIKWSQGFEKANPTLTTPSGNVVSVGTPGYNAEVARLWEEYMKAKPANPVTASPRFIG